MIDAPVVWQEHAEAPIPDALQTWAATRGLRLVAPSPGGQRTIAVDPTVATRIEGQLHAARELVTQHDADGAERALARAEALLRAHPELPQAAWLFAEVERGWAARFARLEPTDAARAARAWRAAAALDGGRMAGLGEPSSAPAASVPFSIELTRSTASVALTLDAAPVSPGPLRAPPGLHQLLARAGGDVVFADWIAVEPQSVVRVAIPSPEPCSSRDLAGAAPACPSWVVAKRGLRDATFFVRVCEAERGCGPELLVAPMSRAPEPPVVVRHGLPTWATVTLVATGVILAGIGASALGWAALPTKSADVWVTSKPQ